MNIYAYSVQFVFAHTLLSDSKYFISWSRLWFSFWSNGQSPGKDDDSPFMAPHATYPILLFMMLSVDGQFRERIYSAIQKKTDKNSTVQNHNPDDRFVLTLFP